MATSKEKYLKYKMKYLKLQSFAKIIGGGYKEDMKTDKDTGNFFVYYPLVIDRGMQPAILPQPVKLPVNNNIVIHFGTNNEAVKLISSLKNVDILEMNNCVNGFNNTIFGQFAYCNAVNFFQDVNNMINEFKITIPFISNSKWVLILSFFHEICLI